MAEQKKRPKLSDIEPKMKPAKKPKLSDINAPAKKPKPGKGGDSERRIDRPGW